LCLLENYFFWVALVLPETLSFTSVSFSCSLFLVVLAQIHASRQRFPAGGPLPGQVSQKNEEPKLLILC